MSQFEEAIFAYMQEIEHNKPTPMDTSINQCEAEKTGETEEDTPEALAAFQRGYAKGGGGKGGAQNKWGTGSGNTWQGAGKSGNQWTGWQRPWQQGSWQQPKGGKDGEKGTGGGKEGGKKGDRGKYMEKRQRMFPRQVLQLRGRGTHSPRMCEQTISQLR